MIELLGGAACRPTWQSMAVNKNGALQIIVEGT